MVSANVAKYFTSGPVLLSYPSGTDSLLQSSSTVGSTGPVPQNAWVAMIPLIVFVILSFIMASYVWGRRKVLLDGAKQSALLFRSVGVPQQIAERLSDGLGAATADLPPDAPALTESDDSVELSAVEIGPTLTRRASASVLTVDATLIGRELAAMAAQGGAAQLAARYSSLADALRALADAGMLIRPDTIGVFLSGGATIWDTEPVPTPDEDLLLDVPKALLRMTLAMRSLPALTLVLDVRRLPGVAYAPDQRIEVRPVGVRTRRASAGAGETGATKVESPLGVYVVIMRYGFAEEPNTDEAVVTLLQQLSTDYPGLARLRHVRCTPSHCRCAEPEHSCLPASFYVAKDSLTGGAPWERVPVGLFNAVQANTNGRAAFLNLPKPQVVEMHGSLDLRTLRYRRAAAAAAAAATTAQAGTAAEPEPEAAAASASADLEQAAR